MPTIIRDVYCNDEYCNEYPVKAKIELNKERVERILTLNETVKELKVLKICEWDYVDYLASDPGDAGDDEEWDGSVECEQCCIYDTSVSWTAILKHTNISIDTDSVSIKELEEIKKVYDTPEENLPLLIESLEYDSSKEVLTERLKSCSSKAT